VKYETIRTNREKAFSEELRQLFNADVIDRIIREGKVENTENWLRAAMEGYSLKISEAMAPRVHTVCERVKASLQFPDPVEFFVHGDRSLNCSAVPRMEQEHPHLVIINSGLLEMVTDDELAFVLGHELGHLISRNSELSRIVRFVFPAGTELPLAIRDKIEIWEKLSEMSADRFGFLACPDLDVCLAVFFKLASGMQTAAIRFEPRAYLEEMERVLEAFRTEMSDWGASHPINPIRLKALQLFEGSALFRTVSGGGELDADPDLRAGMEDLVEILLTKGHSPLAAHRRRFLAAAGLLVAGADGALDPDELESILGPLAGFTHFPAEYFREMVDRKDVGKVFARSAAAILRINPGERFGMLGYMIEVALADRRIDQREVDLIFEVGTGMFQLTRKEVAQLLAQALQARFVPRLVS